MIRIDLGKDENQKKAAKNPFGSSIKLPENLKLPNVKIDVKGLMLIGVVTAFAGLPHLFVMQYQSYVQSHHAFTMKTIEEKEIAAKQEVTKYTSYKREMESYEKQKQLVRERLEVVKRLLANRSTPVNVLDAIGQSLPVRAWLTDIDFKVNPEPNVSFKGKAYSNEDVSDFIDKLSESIHLGDVTLESVTPDKQDKDVDLKGFQVNAIPKGVQPDEPVRAAASTTTPPTPGAAPGTQAGNVAVKPDGTY